MPLGADALPKYQQALKDPNSSLQWSLPGEFVLTRLHARYGKDALGEDLVFRAAGAVVGGRVIRGTLGLEKGATPSGQNNFQGRYIIRRPWPGKIACHNPRRGRWGGPWPDWKGGGDRQVKPAQGLAFADRSGTLAMYVAQDVPELKFVADTPPPALADPKDTKSDPKDTKADPRPTPRTRRSPAAAPARPATPPTGVRRGRPARARPPQATPLDHAYSARAPAEERVAVQAVELLARTLKKGIGGDLPEGDRSRMETASQLFALLGHREQQHPRVNGRRCE